MPCDLEGKSRTTLGPPASRIISTRDEDRRAAAGPVEHHCFRNWRSEEFAGLAPGTWTKAGISETGRNGRSCKYRFGHSVASSDRGCSSGRIGNDRSPSSVIPPTKPCVGSCRRARIRRAGGQRASPRGSTWLKLTPIGVCPTFTLAAQEIGSFAMPVGRLLVSVGELKDGRLMERRAYNLQPNWQPLF